jgi:hypothetical protein
MQGLPAAADRGARQALASLDIRLASVRNEVARGERRHF